MYIQKDMLEQRGDAHTDTHAYTYIQKEGERTEREREMLG